MQFNTTNSNHRYHKWKNLVKGLVPVAANQIWVADITYMELADGNVCYLHLITDAYSHKIIGSSYFVVTVYLLRQISIY